MLEAEDVMALVVDHDHRNDYVSDWFGMALIYGRYTGGTNVYDDIPVGTQSIPNVENIVGLINFCTEARSFGEMLAFMDLTDRTKFRRKYIHPLLNAGILEQTMPDKPNSRNQKYQLTAKGLELIEHLKSNK